MPKAEFPAESQLDRDSLGLPYGESLSLAPIFRREISQLFDVGQRLHVRDD